MRVSNIPEGEHGSIMTVSEVRPRRSRRGVRAAAALGAGVALTATIALAAPAANAATIPGDGIAAVGDICPAGDIFINTGTADTLLLQQYGVDSATGDTTLVNEVGLEAEYGDIAMSADGTTLYGIEFSVPPALHVIDQVTGAATVIDTVTMADGSEAEIALNALSTSRDGLLYAAGPGSGDIWLLDPITAVLEPAGFAFPTLADGVQLTSAGDFLTLDDGDVLGLATSPDSNYLVRFDVEAGTSTVVGQVPTL
ncbi:MAG: hypothetical protein ACTH31_14865, partial [Pseudoclavibacter sp.]